MSIFKNLKKKDEKAVEADSKGTSVSQGRLRFQKDLANLEKCDNIKLSFPHKDDVMNLVVELKVTSGIYKTATFNFNINIPDDYPISPPKVTIQEKVYHPNLEPTGAVCLNILRREWKPILELNHVLFGLIFLFDSPNPTDPLNEAAANTMRQSEDRFKQNVAVSLRGGTVDGIKFDKNKSYSG